MQTSSAIVVAADRLSAGSLGPYGNTWIDTPQWNRLASQSFLFEHALIDSPDLVCVYRSYWGGLHAMCGQVEPRSAGLPRRLAEAGVPSTLLTDESRVANHELAGQFGQRIVLAPIPADRAAADVALTQTALLFAAAVDWLQEASPPFLLWIHSRAMDGPWDAPRSYRQQFVDEQDPPPPDFVTPPCRRLELDFDPDELLGVMQAYAGQVAVLDACLGVLLDALDNIRAAEAPLSAQTALLFTSPRGFPTGEHHRIGACDEALYGELLHTPWIMRFPDQQGAAQRSHALVQPPDLYATLVDWCAGLRADEPASGGSTLPIVRGDRPSLRDRACAVAEGERAIRTPAWFLREASAGKPHRCELFAKPDDRWEVNEVSARCPDVVVQLVEALDQFQRAAPSGGLAQLPPLPQSLLRGPG